jgi:dipeptidyl aminopeptidase/acylaminoacyl peptidase
LFCLCLALASFALVFAGSLSAQTSPALTIDEEVTAFAFASDGRIAFAVRNVFGVRKLQLQRDDIWVATMDGKKTRIVEGKKRFVGPTPFSYSIQSLHWSPDGSRLAVEMYISAMTDERGETKEGYATWLLDAAGKEIKIAQGPGLIEEAANSTWLADGVTVAFIHEAVQPKLLFDIRTLRAASAGGETPFPELTFSAVAWSISPARGSAAVAVERNATLSGSIRLVWLDLQKKERRELAQLAGYVGQLSISPSGKFVAYFRDQETLEVREVSHPDRVGRVRVGYGAFAWAADEERILIKRGTFDTTARGSGRRSGSLAWLKLPPLEAPPPATASSAAKDSTAASAKAVPAPPKTFPASAENVLPDAELQPAMSGLLFQTFAISPDGRWLGVTAPGSRPFQVFPIR